MSKFIIKKTSAGYKFDLKAGNGEIIGSSELYVSKPSCLKGVDSVRNNAVSANLEDLTADSEKSASHPKFEIFRDNSGEYRFRLKARNGEIIVRSEGYAAKSGCLKGIESMRKNAPVANIENEA